MRGAGEEGKDEEQGQCSQGQQRDKGQRSTDIRICFQMPVAYSFCGALQLQNGLADTLQALFLKE